MKLPVRYTGWLLRDAAIRPGLAALACAALATFIATRMPVAMRGGSTDQLMVRFVGQFDWVVILIGTSGLVAWDRSSGFYRTLFSYPIDPALYYLQRWIFAGLATLLLVPFAGLGFLLVTGSFSYSGPLLVRVLIKFLLLGGLTFGLSTVVRADWAIAFLVSLVQTILHGLDSAGMPLGAFSRLLSRGLPPFHLGSFAMTSTPAYPTGPEMLHAALYGIGILSVTMLVLRYRPLGSGGRA